MGLGITIKNLLKTHGKTIKELSEATGISVNTLYSITKRDGITASAEILNKIANFFCVSTDYLLGATSYSGKFTVPDHLNDEELLAYYQSTAERLGKILKQSGKSNLFMQKWAIFLRKLEDHSLTFDEFEELVILYNEALEAREETQDK